MISIAMTTFNGKKYIREQMDSILAQSYIHFELIICDDCSTDSTWAILQEYKEKDTRIHCYKNDYNIGFKKNFEKAISLCKGEYIALADQDDIWTKDHLEVLFNNIKDYSLICSNSELIDAEGKKIGKTFKNKIEIKHTLKYNNKEYFYLLLIRNFVQGCTVLFKQSALTNAFPIPDEIKYHDYWLGLFSSFFDKIIFLDHVTVYYRIHENNSSKTPEISQRFLRHKDYFLTRYNIVSTFYTFCNKGFTQEQDIFCNEIIKYFKFTLKKNNLLFRTFFYISHYSIQYCDEKIIKSFLFFLPRFVFRIFFAPRFSSKNEL
jgi:glycosyltransferase involved in cell wall biosynthesis